MSYCHFFLNTLQVVYPSHATLTLQTTLMEYFSLLHLKKEPFSNSPDPELFFHSYQHKSCLQKLELAIRLKRGLSVVLGDIGTGKSTLSRQLVRLLAKDSSKIDAKLILDPEFTSPNEFLQTILKTFNINGFDGSSEWQMKEAIKNHLFEQGVDLETVSVLIIDEGQKLPGFCLEILREFLNYETNQHKLLQIIIFAQEEFSVSLKEKANFADRITTLQHLRPLSLQETKQMIRFRIKQTRDDSAPSGEIFSPLALLGIHLITKGYPRKIIMLCSKVILNMLVTNKKIAGLKMILSAAKETSFPRTKGRMALVICTIVCLCLLAPILFLNLPAKKQLINKKQSVAPIPTLSTQTHQKTAQTVVITSDITTIPDNLDPLDQLTTQAANKISEPNPPHVITRGLSKLQEKIPKAPTMLGQLTVEEGLSLGYMISSIYGKYTTKRSNAVIAANPRISNPNNIKFGTRINFPQLSVTSQPSPGKFCIELTRTDSLQGGYNFIRNSKELSHELMLRPVLNGKKEFQFQVILKRQYPIMKQAERALEKLPDSYRARIIQS